MELSYDESKKVYRVTGVVECSSCKGTGLYVGMCERNGSAVVCSSCKGTGKDEVKQEFKEFTGRQKRDGISRVFETSGGYVLSGKDEVDGEGHTIHFTQYGARYEDWLSGKKPIPMKQLLCPYQHSNQSMQDESHPWNRLHRIRCVKGIRLGGLISNCKFHTEKDDCWKAIM